MFASHNTRARSAFITATIAALLIAHASNVYAQSPLTVQPSTGRIGVGTTAPQAKIEAKGTDVGISVMNNAGSMNYHFGIKDSDNNKLYIGAGRDPSQGVPPAIVVDGVGAGRKVGIGTTWPGYALHVDAGSTTYGGIALTDSNSSSLVAITNTSNGAANALTQAGDHVLSFHKGAMDTGALVIGTWSLSPKGIRISSSGNVGIGNSAAGNILTIQQNSATDPIADAWTTYSSRRWKTNIEPIAAALDKVQRLRGVTFDWKADGKHDIGLIAEEVGEVIPDVVAYEENGKDAKSVDYARLVAVLIEAVKDQQSQIGELKAEVKTLTGKVRLADATRAASSESVFNK